MAAHTRKTAVDPQIGMCIELGRRRKTLTQAQLGKLIGCSGANISHFEKGRSNPPREKIMALSKVIALPDYIVTGEGGDPGDKAFVAICLQAVREGGPELLAVVESLLPPLLKAQRAGVLPEAAERILKSLD